eukprot:TRINITY_DN10694_c0_g1_i1.p1 TRINITY_DN10694_c0_g1~~TRINITY_DN10694_c0_g1_i1.p1  ORF type:complete len:106 (-),score=22.04 TRINITY_DN10694_c0_g1_i1:257-574(-)
MSYSVDNNFAFNTVDNAAHHLRKLHMGGRARNQNCIDCNGLSSVDCVDCSGTGVAEGQERFGDLAEQCESCAGLKVHPCKKCSSPSLNELYNSLKQEKLSGNNNC